MSKYKLLTALSTEGIDNKVDGAIRDGYSLYGQPIILRNWLQGDFYAQAVVMEAHR